jgi:CRISPR/Cas system-associated exonuclease Cas4 (RecB family)
MHLPVNFQFSQNSLQDYVDCPRRFQLRYLLRQPWPAVASEPLSEFERLMEQGRQFHRLVQRHALGFPESRLSQSIEDPDLRRWWHNYLNSPPPGLPALVRRPEVTLTAPLAGYRLTARYDLLALDPGRRAVVVDWKTSQRRPASADLSTQLQTRVYRFVLVEAGTALNSGIPLAPEQVNMVYWFAEHPRQPELLSYDSAQYAVDAAFLTDLASRIVSQAAGDEQEWSLTTDEQQCRFCSYRSLCARGVVPGNLGDADADRALEIDLEFAFDEIEEIEY